MSSVRGALVFGVAACVLACVPEAGRVDVHFHWEGDPPPADGRSFVFVRIEERTSPQAPGRVLARARPMRFEAGGLKATLEEVPNGEHRICIAEVRTSRWANGHVTHRGSSEPFS